MSETPEENRSSAEGESDDSEDLENWRDPDEEYARLNPAYPDPEDQQSGKGEPEDTSTLFVVIQAFLVPTIVIGAIVLMFLGLRWFFSADYTARELVRKLNRSKGEVRSSTLKSLLVQLSGDEKLTRYRNNETLKRYIYQELRSARSPRRKRYLILLMGILKDDRPERMQLLVEVFESTDNDRIKITGLTAMGMIGDLYFSDRVRSFLDHRDAGFRQAAVYAAGQIGGAKFRSPLVSKLNDQIPHVRLSAAVALSKHYQDLGTETVQRITDVLGQMLDRDVLSGMKQPDEQGNLKDLKVRDMNKMMVNAVQAVRFLKRHHSRHLKNEKLLPKIKAISESTESSRHLRREARRTIQALRSEQS